MTTASRSSGPVRAEVLEDGSLLRLVLDRPKGNILDSEMIAALRAQLGEPLGARPAVRAILFEGQGAHFSYGASVEEHGPGRIRDMLPAFHGLFRDLAATGRVLLSAVRGQCLGGGLELAAFCHRLFASPDAKLGQPEVKLGALAPVASVLLPRRIGQARADDLLLSGRTVDAREALAMGLADEVAEDPFQAALQWHRANVLPRSAAALAWCVRAARADLHRALREDLPAIETMYLEGLMATADAKEGIAAFLEKREPRWAHR